MSLVVPPSFIITIHMASDWHVGSGTGRGEIDSEVQRDTDGLPYIPAKTLTGILRDGCEQVALALDNGDERGKWHNWVNFLFGDQPTLAQDSIEIEPCPAVLSIRSAYLRKELQNALKARPKLKDAIAFIKPGVAIDKETGSANPQALRFEEVVRMDAVLTSKNCTLDFDGYLNITDEQKKIAFALLVAGTKMVERLGGKRRRGNGTCKITLIDDAKTNEWLAYLKENYDKEVGDLPQWKKPELNSSSQSPEADSTWFTIPLTITTQSPIVLPKRTVGNVVECLDYIPGRYFLGHLHKVLGNYMNVGEAIASGYLVMTNATIAIPSIDGVNGVAGRPTPFCLFGEKLAGGLSKGKGVYNHFQEEEPEGIQLKGERGGYLGEWNSNNQHLPQYAVVSLEVNTHNTIDDKSQRPSPETGGAVYSYQAIPAQTVFKAELRLPKSIKERLHSSLKLKDWWTKLDGSMQIGQSKKDQYGTIELKSEEPKLFSSKPEASSNNLLYVWFLSDVLLRDNRLNPTTDPDIFKQVLEKELGLDEGSLEENKDDNLLSLMMRSRRTESWQVRWGLPRPSMLGWQAGSCVVYKVQGEIKAEKLAELEAKGIGDRRAEGYGQICFNDPLLTEKLSHLKREESGTRPDLPALQAIPERDPSFDYARIIETAAWREAIENKALAIASDPKKT
ncbi:RAMP superfamily CRISPR-associated protein [Geitlerinema splendidum]|nr:RAMP superfamily CRISPR-associated protein [Geitlerinema splendidum]